MRKKLLKFLVGYGDKDLYSELLNSDLYTFIEKHRDELQEYPGYADIESEIPHPKDAVKKAFKRYYGNSDQYIEDQAKKLDMPVEDVKKYLTALDYEAKNEAAINERKKEVANWPWYKKAIASDYAKERYIKDPESSIFSDKGEWYNKGEDISDLLYGGAAAVGDFIPGWGGTVVGPAVRAMRDAQHKLYDSPYQKDWSDIATDATIDLGLNIGTDVLPTSLTRYAPRLVKNLKNKFDLGGRKADEFVESINQVDAYNTALEKTNLLEKDLNKFGWDVNADNVGDFAKMTEADLEKKFNTITTPELKEALKSNGAVKVSDNGMITGIDKDKFQDVVYDFWAANEPGKINENFKHLATREDGTINTPMREKMQEGPAGKYITEQYNASNVPPIGKKIAGAERAWSKSGDRLAKEILNISDKRPSSEVKENLDKKYERWAKGFATMDEQKSDEYKQWHEQNLRTMLGLE